MRRQGRELQALELLLEREQELDLLGNRIVDARAGRGSLTLVEAGPGVGKSRLLRAVADIALANGLRAATARGAELERAFPFGVAVQLLEPLWLAADPEERRRLADGPARRAGDLLDGSLTDAGQPQDQAYAIIHGLFAMCRHLTVGADRPEALVVLVDDLQWVDSPSLRFMAYLAQRIDRLPIALVCALRPSETGAEDSPLLLLRGIHATAVLRPAALSDKAVARVVKAAIPEPDPSFCAGCARVTGGNPFLVMELIEQVRAAGQPPDASVAGQLADSAPESVLRSVVNRLMPLPEDARALVAALAVLGDGAQLQHAARLAGLDIETASKAADVLATAHFVHPGTPLSFVHPLVRSAIGQWMGPLDRALAHRRAAYILSEDGASDELVAAHLLVAPPESDPAIVEVLRRAAQRARAKGAAESAARMLQRALDERPRPSRYPDLLAELAEAEVAAGMPQAVESLEHARSVMQEAPRRDQLALTQGRALVETGRHREAAEVLGKAIADDASRDRALSDQLESAYIGAAYGVPELREEAARRAQAIRAELHETPTAAQREVLAHLAVQAAMRGERRREVLDLVDQAWGAGALLETDGPWEGAAMLLISALLFIDELDRDLELCEAAIAHASAVGSPTVAAAVTCLRAWPHYEQGRVDEAARDAQTALDAPLDRWEVFVRAGYRAAACAHLQRGRLNEAATALSILDHPNVGESASAPLLLNARSQLRLAELRPAEALQDAIDAGRQLEAGVGATSPGVIAWRSNAALAHLALGDSERALELSNEELEMARRSDITRIVIRNLRIQGLTQRGKAGLELLGQAVEIGEADSRRLEHIEALVDFGAALRRANRRAAAREPLNKALSLAREGGLTALASRATTELAASGARARRDTLIGVDALTPSQRRVAELAAQNLTTRMIAEALFITPKTVEFHLRQIYQKLNVRSRSELATALGETESA